MARILVTGVSTGLGRALAEWHLRAGDNVLGLSRSSPLNLELMNELGHFKFQPCDVRRQDQVETAIADNLRPNEVLDLVYLNAGILGTFGDLQEQRLSDLEATMQTNLWANKLLMDALGQGDHQIRRVIAISSGAAVNGHRGWSGYALSKAALNMMVQLYAAEMPHCHWLALAPGLVDTAMQDELCGREREEKYPSLDRLKAARGTELMPGPAVTAARIGGLLGQLRKFKSGAYVDIRNLDGDS